MAKTHLLKLSGAVVAARAPRRYDAVRRRDRGPPLFPRGRGPSGRCSRSFP